MEDCADAKYVNPLFLLHANIEHYEEMERNEGGRQIGATASNSNFYELFKAQHLAYCMLQEKLLLSSIDQQCITTTTTTQQPTTTTATTTSAATTTATAPVTPAAVISPPGTAGSIHPSAIAINGPVVDGLLSSLGLLSLGKLRDAVLEFDPLKTRNEVNEVLARGIGEDVAEVLLLEARREEVSVEAFKRRVRRAVIRRSAPIPASKKKK